MVLLLFVLILLFGCFPSAPREERGNAFFVCQSWNGFFEIETLGVRQCEGFAFAGRNFILSFYLDGSIDMSFILSSGDFVTVWTVPSLIFEHKGATLISFMREVGGSYVLAGGENSDITVARVLSKDFLSDSFGLGTGIDIFFATTYIGPPKMSMLPSPFEQFLALGTKFVEVEAEVGRDEFVVISDPFLPFFVEDFPSQNYFWFSPVSLAVRGAKSVVLPFLGRTSIAKISEDDFGVYAIDEIDVISGRRIVAVFSSADAETFEVEFPECSTDMLVVFYSAELTPVAGGIVGCPKAKVMLTPYSTLFARFYVFARGQYRDFEINFFRFFDGVKLTKEFVREILAEISSLVSKTVKVADGIDFNFDNGKFSFNLPDSALASFDFFWVEGEFPSRSSAVGLHRTILFSKSGQVEGEIFPVLRKEVFDFMREEVEGVSTFRRVPEFRLFSSSFTVRFREKDFVVLVRRGLY